MLNLFRDRLLGNRESISLAGSVPGNYPSNAYLLIESLENAWKVPDDGRDIYGIAGILSRREPRI